jgi:hypothetical protein
VDEPDVLVERGLLDGGVVALRAAEAHLVAARVLPQHVHFQQALCRLQKSIRFGLLAGAVENSIELTRNAFKFAETACEIGAQVLALDALLVSARHVLHEVGLERAAEAAILALVTNKISDDHSRNFVIKWSLTLKSPSSWCCLRCRLSPALLLNSLPHRLHLPLLESLPAACWFMWRKYRFLLHDSKLQSSQLELSSGRSKSRSNSQQKRNLHEHFADAMLFEHVDLELVLAFDASDFAHRTAQDVLLLMCTSKEQRYALSQWLRKCKINAI